MKNSSKRILSILGSMGFLVFSLVVFVYLLQPSYVNISEMRGELSGKEQLLTEYRLVKEKVDQLKKDYQNVVQIKDSISSILPLENSVSEKINQINGLADISKAKLTSVSIQKLSIKQPADSKSDLSKGVGVIQMNIKLESPFENFDNFLGSLESNLSLMDLVNLKIDNNVNQVGGTADSISYNLTVNTYYQAE